MKFRTTLGVILIALLCAGCDVRVYSHEIDGYQKACVAHGGVALINNLSNNARCKNGVVVDWKED